MSTGSSCSQNSTRFSEGGARFSEGLLGSPPACDCPGGGGIKARLRVSKSSLNPGRRFYGCGRWSPQDNGRSSCQFFMWVDPDLLSLQASIHSLEMKVNLAFESIFAHQRMEKMLLFALFVVLVAWVCSKFGKGM